MKRLTTPLAVLISFALSITLTSCGGSEKDSLGDNSNPAASSESTPASTASKLDEVSQRAQDAILSKPAAEIGSTDKPLTPNGYADLTTKPQVLIGEITLGVGHTLLVTVNADRPGTFEVVGLQKASNTSAGFVSIAAPVTEAGSYLLNYVYTDGTVLKLGSVSVK